MDEGGAGSRERDTEPSVERRGDQASHLLTFLIADVRGYTSFTEEHGDQAAARLAERFANLTDEIVTAWRGRVIELRGDEALAVFDSVRDALHAGVDLQTRFTDPSGGAFPIEVRIGIDVGDAIPVRGGYRSGALNRAARLQSIARPGEVLTTDMVVSLARKTEGLVTLDRGETRLKGFTDPVKVFQVAAEDSVPAEVSKFSVQPPPQTNLAPQQTRFVGREPETEEVVALLESADIRLLTLTGPGGIGKTRLAIRASEVAAGSFEDGVFFVPLASARDSASVFQLIALALGVEETTSPSPAVVSHYIGSKHLLLILDNFEQVVADAPQLAQLIAACPGLRILVTSREVLRLYGEQEYRVPPLRVPTAGDLMAFAEIAEFESVRLFLDRVSLRQPGFALTEENASAIAEVCRRLEGLPLAIELAAARIKVFPPHLLLLRLDDRLGLLTGGSRDLPSRQQTLRNAIAWSYDLLDASEQVLFRRLAVFVGGCTLEAAEQVCNRAGDLQIDVLDGLESLVDKSLVQQYEGPGPAGYPEARFVMLETIREFALEQLERSGEFDDLRRRHAGYFSSLAEQSYLKLVNAARDPWRAMWNVEWGNLRAMLQWSLEARRPEIGLPAAGFLWVWCWLDGPIEIRDWVERLLAMPEAQKPSRARGWGLGAAALLAWHTGDLERVRDLSAPVVETARACGDDILLAGVLMIAATLDESARPLIEEARALFRAQGNVFGVGFAAVAGVRSLLAEGDTATLQSWLDEALQDFRRTGDVFGQGLVLRTAGTLAVGARDLHTGRAYLVEALDRFRAMREKRYLPLVLLTLGGISRLLGDVERAADEFREALDFVYRYTGRGNLASCIEGLAAVAVEKGEMERAARLLGAARKMRDSSGSVPFPIGEVFNAGIEERCRASMDAETFVRLWTEGSWMEEREAVQLALHVDPMDVWQPCG
jgi:predicted ATPase/class 3 adenylate cyclase